MPLAGCLLSPLWSASRFGWHISSALPREHSKRYVDPHEGPGDAVEFMDSINTVLCFTALPVAHHAVRRFTQNQEGTGEVTGHLCSRGRSHQDYKRLLPRFRERLQLMRGDKRMGPIGFGYIFDFLHPCKKVSNHPLKCRCGGLRRDVIKGG